MSVENMCQHVCMCGVLLHNRLRMRHIQCVYETKCWQHSKRIFSLHTTEHAKQKDTFLERIWCISWVKDAFSYLRFYEFLLRIVSYCSFQNFLYIFHNNINKQKRKFTQNSVNKSLYGECKYSSSLHSIYYTEYQMTPYLLYCLDCCLYSTWKTYITE